MTAEKRGSRYGDEPERDYRKFFLLVVLVLLLLVLLFSASRAGITGTFLGMGCFFVLSRLRSNQTPLAVKVSIVAVAGLILFYGARIGFDGIIDRFMRIDEISSRILFWQDGRAMLKDHPYGIGLANTVDVSPMYYTSPTADRMVLDHLHNDYLQLFVETGWIGGGRPFRHRGHHVSQFF